MDNPLKTQVGGSHYKDFVIQPIEFIQKNNLGFIEGSIIKYICRYPIKGGIEDLDKIIHYCQLLKKLKFNHSEALTLSNKVPNPITVEKNFP